MKMHANVSNLVAVLIKEKFCSTYEEADAIAYAIDDDPEQGLQDYLGISLQDAQQILRQASAENKNDENSVVSEEEEADSDSSSITDENDKDGPSTYIGEGECALCERYIRLTRHHLVPRCTWSRLEPRLMRALEAVDHSSNEGLEYLLERIRNSEGLTLKQRVRRALQTTCDVCRPCHSTIHRTHDNMTLALHYNTLEKLLEDNIIYSFCQWANKQRCGKFGLSHNSRR